jgi:hypothetical protein
MLDSLLQDIGITISVHAYTIIDKKRWNEPKINIIRRYRSKHFMLWRKQHFLTIVNLPVPTIQTMRIIIQFKTFSFSGIIVVDICSFIYAIQNTSPGRASVYPSANL